MFSKSLQTAYNSNQNIYNGLQNVLEFTVSLILQRIADRIYGIHKLHSNYSREFTDWAAVEKDMADGLNSAGHYMEM